MLSEKWLLEFQWVLANKRICEPLTSNVFVNNCILATFLLTSLYAIHGGDIDSAVLQLGRMGQWDVGGCYVSDNIWWLLFLAVERPWLPLEPFFSALHNAHGYRQSVYTFLTLYIIYSLDKFLLALNAKSSLMSGYGCVKCS